MSLAPLDSESISMTKCSKAFCFCTKLKYQRILWIQGRNVVLAGKLPTSDRSIIPRRMCHVSAMDINSYSTVCLIRALRSRL